MTMESRANKISQKRKSLGKIVVQETRCSDNPGGGRRNTYMPSNTEAKHILLLEFLRTVVLYGLKWEETDDCYLADTAIKTA